VLRSHPTARAAGLVVALAALTAGGFALAAGTSAAGTNRHAAVTTVTVAASEFKFKLSRTTAPVGTVVFKLVNKGKIAHNFAIDGKKTPLLNPGKSATLKVVFKKKGRFAYLCTVPGHAKLGMKGVFGVGTTAPAPAPPPKTTTTTAAPGPGGTVQVSMFEYGFTLSPSTIPSGNVTFVMNNTGTVTHNFDVGGVKAGPFVDPGKSATMTVNVTAGKAYSYLCDVPGHAALGMRGTFTPSS
jgi:nitrite reductase (NO-forming)